MFTDEDRDDLKKVALRKAGVCGVAGKAKDPWALKGLRFGMLKRTIIFPSTTFPVQLITGVRTRTPVILLFVFGCSRIEAL